VVSSGLNLTVSSLASDPRAILYRTNLVLRVLEKPERLDLDHLAPIGTSATTYAGSMNQTRALAGSVSRSFSSLSLSLCFYELFLERCLSRAIPRAESASRFDVCDRRDSNGIKTIIRPTCKRPPSFLRPPFAAFHYPREIESADQLPRPLARLLSGEGGGGGGEGRSKSCERGKNRAHARIYPRRNLDGRISLPSLSLSLFLCSPAIARVADSAHVSAKRSAPRNAPFPGRIRRLLIRGVWFSFALQFNPAESRGIFASISTRRSSSVRRRSFHSISRDAASLSSRATRRSHPSGSFSRSARFTASNFAN